MVATNIETHIQLFLFQVLYLTVPASVASDHLVVMCNESVKTESCSEGETALGQV